MKKNVEEFKFVRQIKLIFVQISNLWVENLLAAKTAWEWWRYCESSSGELMGNEASRVWSIILLLAVREWVQRENPVKTGIYESGPRCKNSHHPATFRSMQHRRACELAYTHTNTGATWINYASHITFGQHAAKTIIHTMKNWNANNRFFPRLLPRPLPRPLLLLLFWLFWLFQCVLAIKTVALNRIYTSIINWRDAIRSLFAVRSRPKKKPNMQFSNGAHDNQSHDMHKFTYCIIIIMLRPMELSMWWYSGKSSVEINCFDTTFDKLGERKNRSSTMPSRVGERECDWKTGPANKLLPNRIFVFFDWLRSIECSIVFSIYSMFLFRFFFENMFEFHTSIKFYRKNAHKLDHNEFSFFHRLMCATAPWMEIFSAENSNVSLAHKTHPDQEVRNGKIFTNIHEHNHDIIWKSKFNYRKWFRLFGSMSTLHTHTHTQHAQHVRFVGEWVHWKSEQRSGHYAWQWSSSSSS